MTIIERIAPATTRRPFVVYVVTVAHMIRFLRPHYRHLQRRGFRIGLVSSPAPELNDLAREDNISIYPMTIYREIKLVRDAAALFQLSRLLRQIRPDIVHSISPKGGLLGSLAGRLSGVPVVALSVFGLRQMTLTGTMRTLM